MRACSCEIVPASTYKDVKCQMFKAFLKPFNQFCECGPFLLLLFRDVEKNCQYHGFGFVPALSEVPLLAPAAVPESDWDCDELPAASSLMDTWNKSCYVKTLHRASFHLSLLKCVITLRKTRCRSSLCFNVSIFLHISSLVYLTFEQDL